MARWNLNHPVTDVALAFGSTWANCHCRGSLIKQRLWGKCSRSEKTVARISVPPTLFPPNPKNSAIPNNFEIPCGFLSNQSLSGDVQPVNIGKDYRICGLCDAARKEGIGGVRGTMSPAQSSPKLERAAPVRVSVSSRGCSTGVKSVRYTFGNRPLELVPIFRLHPAARHSGRRLLPGSTQHRYRRRNSSG